MTTTLQEKVKGALRITTNAPLILSEVDNLIEACRLDLITSGISPAKANDEKDPLIEMAIKLYAKSKFGFDNKDAPRFKASYESLKQKLSIASDYNGKME